MIISTDIERAIAELKRILRALQELPTVEEVTVSEGGSSDVTVKFRETLALAAETLGDVTARTLEKLNATHDTIRAAVLQISEQDEQLADEAKLIVSMLDSAVGQTVESTDDGSDEADF
ncbi:hypothetical protein [Microbacterium sp.]|uniref:hypothetical protein n=1 Tax=Microbacterium sp. TaxID=51671 RepID=UPI0039E6E017